MNIKMIDLFDLEKKISQKILKIRVLTLFVLLLNFTFIDFFIKCTQKKKFLILQSLGTFYSKIEN